MTITFHNQWTSDDGKSLRAIPHLTTTNSSFLRMCQLLKRMNIKNYAFPLALYDPDLKDVNVYDLEEETAENNDLRIKVMIESRRNGWYFLREVVKIYEQGGAPVSFRLDRGSTAMAWCFFNGLDYCGMQPRQTGKLAPLDSFVRTPTGWCKMGDLALYDDVVTPDGGIAPIIGIYPQGEHDIYRVYFEDGRWSDCGDEHLWKVYWPHWGEAEGGKWRVLTLGEIRAHMEKHQRSNNRLSIQLIEPERKEDIDLPIDPYVLGVILGDGNISNGTVNITKPDQFIKDELDRLLYPYYTTSDWHADKESYCIVAINDTPHLRHDLEKLGLWGTVCDTKFIPDLYMNASPRQRLSLIQGLMDTDGTVETPRLCADGVTPKHGAIEYNTTSLKMAHQFQEIIRALGGLCKLSERYTYYTYKGEKKKGKLSFRVNPRVKDRSLLFRLPRKRDLTLGDYKYQDSLKLAIRSVEYIGRHEAQCIEVDHPDHLYIAGDYVVTHNTVCALSVMAWVLYSSGYEFQCGMMAKDNKLREENVKRVKAFGENLPSWWLSEDKFKDKKNTTELYYNAMRTHYQSFVAQTDKRAADLQARGASPPVFHFDEFEFSANIGTSYPTILASTGTARENAKKNGKPHSNIITTTAGDPMKIECKEAMTILEGAVPFTELFYDIEDNEKLHAVVEASSPQKMIMGVFSHLQLGYDNKWLRDKMTRNRMTPDQVMRDYLNRRVSIQDNPVIPKNTLAIINRSQEEPNHIQMLADKFVIFWYLPKEVVSSPSFRDRPIVVGCDSSEMIGRDATTLIGIDPRSLETVFSFRCSEGNLTVTGTMIADLLLRYPNMILVPENKSSGTAFIDNISLILRNERHNPFLRMFNWIVQNKNEESFAQYNIKDMSLLDTNAKRFFGIKTDKSKREELYSSVLLEAANRAASRIKDRNLISELGSLTVRNGRVDHAAGGHDDTCFVGSTLVRTDTGNRQISDLKLGDMVLTREGYKPILHIFCREKEVITKFGLTGTPDHPFITPKGIVPFEELNLESKVYVWNEKLSCITERRIIDTLTLKESNIKTTSTDTIKTMNLLSRFIDKSGKTIKDLFQKASTSIMSMRINQTTTLKTLNVYLLKNTKRNILFQKRLLDKTVFEQKSKIILDNGERTILTPLENMPVTMERKVRDWQIGEEKTRNLLEKSTKKRHRKALKQEPEKELVYNLHIADCHEYFVNDILVHNCVAWLMAMWFILNGKHLDMYGIKPGTILSQMNAGQPDKNKLSEEHQTKIRTKIEDLERLLRYQQDPSAKRLIESDITLYKSMVENSVVLKPTTADELNRDPRKYTDRETAAQSRTPVSVDSMKDSMRMMLRLH